jgi:zinc/manganese transport system substrate-binding protein
MVALFPKNGNESHFCVRVPAVRTGTVIAALVAAAVCAASGAGAPRGGVLQVVAAENFWGSVAAQLGGDRVHVTSLITNPATDPHDYEPTAVDARTLAGAKLAIVNGIGYDPWAPKLLSANPVQGRIVLTVGDVVGVKAGGNPHRWYSPTDVQRVIAAIVADYTKLAPEDAAYFAREKKLFETKGLAGYKAEIARIRHRYAGVPVGASESIFALMAPALGLKLVTPSAFLKAISEGTDPTAQDKAIVDRQIAKREIKVWVFNSQNSTPDVARLTSAARHKSIPVTTITETLTPATATFEAWQVAQLRALRAALARATGR